MATLNVNGVGVITYKEIPGSPREQMSGQVWRVTRTFDVDHSRRWDFLLGMFGDATISVDPVTHIARSIPQGFAVQMSNGKYAWLYPTSVESIEPLGIATWDTNTQTATYDQCRITIGYEAPHYTVADDNDPAFIDADYSESYLGRFVAVFVQPTAEYLTLPYGAYRWVNFDAATQTTSKGTPVVGSQALLVASLEVQLSWHMVPGIPSSAFSQIGTVNNAIFTDTQNRFFADKGTLLLTQMELRPYRWFRGNYLYDITYKFKYFNPTDPATDLTVDEMKNPIGHNHFLQNRTVSGDPPIYRYLTHDGTPPAGTARPGTGRPVYRYTNFDDLFNPPLNGN